METHQLLDSERIQREISLALQRYLFYSSLPLISSSDHNLLSYKKDFVILFILLNASG